MINVFQPKLGNEEIESIRKVFNSNWLGKGALTKELEKKFAEWAFEKPDHFVSTNSCTEGLFESMRTLGIHSGDEVIMPTISFVGAANAVGFCGAKPVFCDVDRKTLNTSAEYIEKKITEKTKVIIVLHYGGVPCDMDSIVELAENRGIKVVEDSACAVASRYKGKLCGTIGDIGMWSFDAMKILVSGDGAMMYFKDIEDSKWAAKDMYFGLESGSGFSNKVDTKWWEFEVSGFGHRAIMNDITAAMALEQLKKLPSFIKRRKEIAEYYDRELGGVDWIECPPRISDQCESSYYLYHIQIHDKKRDELAKYLRENDVYTTFRYYPLHWVKYYGVNESLPEAEYAAKNTLCIPLHQSLTDDDLDKIVTLIKKFGKERM